jgi:hypothetical protein
MFKELGSVGAILYGNSLYFLHRQKYSFHHFLENSTIVWLFFSLVIGAAVVQFNVVVIGGKLSYFQAFSILSYCIFPIFLTTLVIVILNFFNVKNKVVNKILMAIATVWAVACTYAIYEAIKVFLGANVA